MKETIIRPQSVWKLLDLRAIWEYRELFYILAWRDIKVRYRQTVLGVIWVVLQPLTSMLIFSLLFGRYAKVPSGDLPYPLFVLSGIVYWNLFSNAITNANDSMLANENLIKKVYFPKIILPLASYVTTMVDFSFNMILLLGFAIILGYVPHWQFFIVFPLSLIMTSITAVGFGLLFSSLNVKYRDVRYVIPHIMQVLFFFTPIIYPLSIVSPTNRNILSLNPMVTVIEAVRISLIGGNFPYSQIIIISITSALAVFIIGLIYFAKTEKFFADIL